MNQSGRWFELETVADYIYRIPLSYRTPPPYSTVPVRRACLLYRGRRAAGSAISIDIDCAIYRIPTVISDEHGVGYPTIASILTRSMKTTTLDVKSNTRDLQQVSCRIPDFVLLSADGAHH